MFQIFSRANGKSQFCHQAAETAALGLRRNGAVAISSATSSPGTRSLPGSVAALVVAQRMGMGKSQKLPTFSWQCHQRLFHSHKNSNQSLWNSSSDQQCYDDDDDDDDDWIIEDINAYKILCNITDDDVEEKLDNDKERDGPNPKKYFNITIDEMGAFLADQQFFLKNDDSYCNGGRVRAREYVYCKPMERNPNVMIHIYTGIDKNSGESRKIGTDAIRVVVLDHTGGNEKGKSLVKKSKMHKRIPTWKKNIQQTINEMEDKYNHRPCDRASCGSPMVKRINSKNGKEFLSCSAWSRSKCNHKINLGARETRQKEGSKRIKKEKKISRPSKPAAGGERKSNDHDEEDDIKQCYDVDDDDDWEYVQPQFHKSELIPSRAAPNSSKERGKQLSGKGKRSSIQPQFHKSELIPLRAAPNSSKERGKQLSGKGKRSTIQPQFHKSELIPLRAAPNSSKERGKQLSGKGNGQ